MTARLLVLSADDHGLSDGSSRGILRAHDTRLSSSVPVLAVGPATGRAVAGLRDRPVVGAGAQLAVVGEDRPLLTACEIPTLVGHHGAFRPGGGRS
ncbi:ChbG/HpnK family deacetylase [Streptomyces sp. AA1529]|uniref:ChbG/HpnK family deacetylase n=1 Tax=Streptomyces sp. AA1529 TaxID=1203257 RepID=UPI003D7030DB